MHIGLCGSGRMAAIHAESLAMHPAVDTVTMVGSYAAEVRRLSATFGLRVAPSVEELLAAGVDGLVIASATPHHEPLIDTSLAAGLRAIFCEKPLSTSLATTGRLVASAAKQGAEIQVGYNRRFDPGYREAKRLIASGQAGELLSIRVNSFDRDPPPEPYLAVSGGIFLDMMVHDFDLVSWLTDGEVTEVFALGAAVSDPMFQRYDDVDTTVVALRTSTGTPVVVAGGRVNPSGYDCRLEVLGTRDTFVAGFDARCPVRVLEDDDAREGPPRYTGFADRWHTSYRDEMTAFLALVAGDEPNRCPAAADLQAQRIAQAADRSFREGRAVAVGGEPPVTSSPRGTQGRADRWAPTPATER